MTKNELIASAAELEQPSSETAATYGRKREFMAKEVTRILAERPDIDRLVGEGNLPMMADNHKNHALFMESLFLSYSPDVFTETVLWVFRAYRSHGFRLTYWPAQLNAWLEVIGSEFTDKELKELAPFYEWMLVNQASFAALSEEGDSFWESKPPSHT